MMDNLLIGFVLLIALIVIFSVIMAAYSTKKHYEIKKKEIELQQERLAMEWRKIEIEEKKGK